MLLASRRRLEAARSTQRSWRAGREQAPEGEADGPSREGAAWATGTDQAHSHQGPGCPPGWAGEGAGGSCEHGGAGERVTAQADCRAWRVARESPGPPCCVQEEEEEEEEERGSLESIAEAWGASSSPSPQQPPPKRTLRKAQSFDLPCAESLHSSCQRALSEPPRHGLGPGPSHPGSTTLPWSRSRLRHIADEMVVTEREYVRSLRFVLESYFPEMEQPGLPQELRGKRSVIFGNLEKLHEFHSQYFLRELENCRKHPLRVGHCFLRHVNQFGMYALYSKNKPKSDVLLASRGNVFFRVKQLQLGDKMDLASYLLKPIQRMSKYGLLLKDLIRQGEGAQEHELVCLRAAEEMVRFQLRHGNDLLAMDALRNCDVNLKEQGQLVRQEEFGVTVGRRKCQRHVFLFEELILFSKPKRVEGGLDVYLYKRSFKTADIGLTENSGESGLRFEIWFRRRKAGDTYILQASSREAKQAWTRDIARLLWEQAARNKEIRLQEMVSMGVGNKPFLDIKPSEAAIQNRAIDYLMKGRGARTRASIAVSLFDHTDPYRRSQAPPPAGGPSSCSVLGPLNLHTYQDQALLPSVLAGSRPFCARAGIEEEAENETGSQPSLGTHNLPPEGCGHRPASSASGQAAGSSQFCTSGLSLGKGRGSQPFAPRT
uniref:Pleckstrin homology and RhoGEF domain containing G4 n=1 Tax=Varanus komodoensis TaxID=61221 RepID=A0A8D2LCA7_VARKO